ncbi:MAG: T9SS type A sorting domain-containing protein [Saprospiraceae bacterium]|nr:T9SS type A sorting domain-containing protein [Saprospiraceae bacterium]
MRDNTPHGTCYAGWTKEQRAKKFSEEVRIHHLKHTATSLQNFKKRLDSVITEEKLLPDIKRKSAYTYQSTQPGARLTQQIDYIWVATNQIWIPESRRQITYDPDGNIVNYLVQFREQNNLVNYSQSDFDYSPDGLVNRILYYEWNAGQNMWELLSKDTILYDNKFNIKSGEYFLWDSAKKKWNKEILTEHEYNAKSQIISKTYSRWNQQWSNYFFEAREEFSYHPNGKQFEFITSSWDEVSADWVYTHKFSDLYDAAGKLILYQQHVHDGTIWIGNSKTEITYDPNDNPIRFVNSEWNETLNKWELFFKWENEYDNSISFQEILLPDPEDEESQMEFNHLLLRTNYFGYNAGNPVNDAFEIYYYSNIQSVGTKNSKHSEDWVYPNPARDVLFLKTNPEQSSIHFKLSNMDGTELIDKTLIHTNRISLAPVPQGIYFYTIKDQKKIYSGKIYIE